MVLCLKIYNNVDFRENLYTIVSELKGWGSIAGNGTSSSLKLWAVEEASQISSPDIIR